MDEREVKWGRAKMGQRLYLLRDSLVHFRLIEAFKVQRHVKEDRERYGQKKKKKKALKNRPSLVMAWFVCFHILT